MALGWFCERVAWVLFRGVRDGGWEGEIGERPSVLHGWGVCAGRIRAHCAALGRSRALTLPFWHDAALTTTTTTTTATIHSAALHAIRTRYFLEFFLYSIKN